jgi:hypothetical protein
MHFKKSRENTWRNPEGVGPYNQSQNWVPKPPNIHGRHCEFDLDSEGGLREFRRKKSKMEYFRTQTDSTSIFQFITQTHSTSIFQNTNT